MVSLFIMGLLLDAYVFFNMTYPGLYQALTIFGFSIAIDFLFLRLLANLLFGIIQGIINNKMKTPLIDHDVE